MRNLIREDEYTIIYAIKSILENSLSVIDYNIKYEHNIIKDPYFKINLTINEELYDAENLSKKLIGGKNIEILIREYTHEYGLQCVFCKNIKG
ncbi:MAG: hypothetical protein ACOCP8_00290 [archaeon]